MKLTDELKEKAKAAKSPEELLELAKSEGEEISEEQAKDFYFHLHQESGEVSDEELSAVAGGGCGEEAYVEPNPVCPVNIGDKITIPSGSWMFTTFGNEIYVRHPYACPTCGSEAWVVTGIGFPYKATDGTNAHGTVTSILYTTWDVYVKCAGCGQIEKTIRKQNGR